ncbi:MAG: PAS domain-containing sensor histidine kinase [Coriobacteriia bacterium]
MTQKLSGTVDRRRETRAPREEMPLVLDWFPNPVRYVGPDGRCIRVNRAWLEFTGRSNREEIGSGWAEGIHPDDAADVSAALLRPSVSREPYRVEYRLRRHDGRYRWILEQGVPVPGVTGTRVATCYDITDSKDCEQMREDFVRYSAHDLRAGLVAIAGFGDLADAACKQGAVTAAADLSHRIAERSRELCAIVDELAIAACLAGGGVRPEVERVDPLDIAMRSLGTLRALDGDRVRLRAHGSLSPVRGDAELLVSSLARLLANGLRHAPDDTDVLLDVSDDCDETRFCVTDLGPASRRDDLRRRRGEIVRAGDGPAGRKASDGFGLYVADRIAEAHGGWIEATSTSSSGTTFTLVVPHWA